MGVDDVIPANELVVGIQLLPGMFLNVRAAAGTYNKGQALAISNGRVTSGGTASAVLFVEEDKATTVAAGDLLRVVVK
ncbi:hypothetical protein [Cronobacter sakazakii]|nr:hypothetical protein [Cronobacter sakazakii]